MSEFVFPIVVFADILITGAVVGSIMYFATYFQNPHHKRTKCSIQVGKIY